MSSPSLSSRLGLPSSSRFSPEEEEAVLPAAFVRSAMFRPCVDTVGIVGDEGAASTDPGSCVNGTLGPADAYLALKSFFSHFFP